MFENKAMDSIVQHLADVLRKVEHGYIMEAPDGCPSPIYDLMKTSWKLDPEERPSFVEAKATLGRLRITFIAQST